MLAADKITQELAASKKDGEAQEAMVTSKTKIETGFLEKQAKANSSRGTSRSVLAFFTIMLVSVAAFGIYKAVEFVLGFQTFQHIRNMSLVLKAPRVEQGKAFVDVTIHNANAYSVSEPVFNYSIADSSGKEVVAGEVKVAGVIPAADQRTFPNIDLGETKGEPAKLHSDLVKVTASTPENLPSGFASRFSSAMTSEDRLTSLTALEIEAPKYAPLKVAIGILYEAKNNLNQAIDYYRQGVDLDQDNANAHYHLGRALLSKQKNKEALKHLSEAVELNPIDPAATKMLNSLKTD